MPDIETQRQREEQRSHNATMPVAMTGKVVGVSFTPGYPDHLTRLADIALDRHNHDEPLRAVLIRNPQNQYDTNAIEVHVVALGRENSMIGHLPRALAARLAPSMDFGDQWAATVTQVLIHPDHPENPGIEISIRRIPGETP